MLRVVVEIQNYIYIHKFRWEFLIVLPLLLYRLEIANFREKCDTSLAYVTVATSPQGRR